MKRFFSHLPACVDEFAAGMSRASAIISAIACSAVVIELPNGVFITMMPAAVAAGTSILSTPIPARPITFRFFAAFSTSAFTFVDERTASPSYSPMIFKSSSFDKPVLVSASTPRSLKIATAAGDN